MATLKEEFNTRLQKIKDGIPENERAIMTEDLLDLESSVITLIDDLESKKVEMGKMQEEHDNLLKVNGRLAQRISFESSQATTFNNSTAGSNQGKKEEEKIELSSFINEKGELI